MQRRSPQRADPRCPSPRRRPGCPPGPPLRPRRRRLRVFELLHKLLTGGAALATLLRLLF